MNNHKILEAAFKEQFRDGWESELRDFELIGNGWYEAVLLAMEKASEGSNYKTISGSEIPVTGHHKTNF